jgi:hypothetical protein
VEVKEPIKKAPKPVVAAEDAEVISEEKDAEGETKVEEPTDAADAKPEKKS